MNERRRMPAEREGITHKFTIRGEDGDHDGYLTANVFPDGTLGEIFVKMDQQGSAESGFVDAWAISFSMLLQQGVPLPVLVEKFSNASFPPSGMTNSEHVRIAKSPIDYIARYLKARFVKSEEKAA